MFDLRLAFLLGSVCIAVSTDATAQESQNAFRWVNPLPADRTPLVKHGTYFSRLHDTKVGFYIYLPPGYDDAKKAEHRYPVVYYLHGGRKPRERACRRQPLRTGDQRHPKSAGSRHPPHPQPHDREAGDGEERERQAPCRRVEAEQLERQGRSTNT